MSKNADLPTAHLSRLEALRSKHQKIQQQIEDGLKHPPSHELESFIKSKKLEKLKVKEKIEGLRA